MLGGSSTAPTRFEHRPCDVYEVRYTAHHSVPRDNDRQRKGEGMMSSERHWSREPGRWEAAFTPAAYAMIPTITTPRPSPDGRFVAYSRGYDGRVDLMVVPVAGGASLQLSDDP